MQCQKQYNNENANKIFAGQESQIEENENFASAFLVKFLFGTTDLLPLLFLFATNEFFNESLPIIGLFRCFIAGPDVNL